MNALQTIDVHKTYGSGQTAVKALDGLSLDIEAGQFTAIMGPSGSGKSTLLHVMAALDTVDGGQIKIGDKQITKLGEKKLTALRRDKIGFVFQSFNLIPTLTAGENISLPLALAGRKADPAWFDAVIDLTGLRDRLAHRPSELSGGQQQRVAVARAIVSRPEIVFADEPTGNLDSRASAEILQCLRQAVDDHGQTVVMVTHDPNAASYSDRAIFLSDGRIVDELPSPTTDLVLDRIKKLGE